MVSRIIFDDDGEAIKSSEDEKLLSDSNVNEEPINNSNNSENDDSNDDVPQEESSHIQKNDSDDDSDSDDAPEEVSVSSSKAHTMELYERQRQAAIATKRRKRKQRTIVEDDGLDESTLQLLAQNTESLSAKSTSGKEEHESKRIDLIHPTVEATEKVEKEVEGFKLVALPKDPNAGIGKPISADILKFQRNHFYGKNTHRVDSGSFMSQRKIRNTRRYYCLL